MRRNDEAGTGDLAAGCQLNSWNRRRARRTGNVFYGCSNYPKCDFTTNHEPVGAVGDEEVGVEGQVGTMLLDGAKRLDDDARLAERGVDLRSAEFVEPT